MNEIRKAQFWIRRIDEMLKNVHYQFAHDTLGGLKESIEARESVTDRQIQAIKNIRWGKNQLED